MPLSIGAFVCNRVQMSRNSPKAGQAACLASLVRTLPACGVSRGLAELTRGTQVTVNSVLPGPTRSEGSIDFLRSTSTNPDASAEQLEADFFAKFRPSSLLKRMTDPEEIANLVAYVASPLSSATNGAALRVDGGVRAQTRFELQPHRAIRSL